MTSHTFVAQTAAAAPAFNTAFYATAATVIPVLFLAIAVQGTTILSLAQQVARSGEKQNTPGISVIEAAKALGTGMGSMAAILVIIYAGHYATETLGVRALAAHVGQQFGMPWSFIEAPTGT